MAQLSKAEQQLMDLIWAKETLFFKDLADSYPEPRPAATTLATLLKRMHDKGFIAYTVLGHSRQYYALVKKSDYFTKQVKGMIENSFDRSAFQFSSFVIKSSNLTKGELEDLRKIIDKEIKKKKK